MVELRGRLASMVVGVMRAALVGCVAATFIGVAPATAQKSPLGETERGFDGDGGGGVAPGQGGPRPGGPGRGEEVQPEPRGGGRRGEQTFSESEWRDYAAGRTLYYELNGRLVGREYYPPNGDRVIFEYANGRCFDGTWFIQNGLFCFNYDQTHCFEHVRRGGEVYARETDGDEQRVTRRTDEILSCQPGVLSEADGDARRVTWIPSDPEIRRLLAAVGAPQVMLVAQTSAAQGAVVE